ncbi:MAG: ADP-ribosylglycohydrolase family protein [Actinobacteria bacterium]|nr:ADP-ribosylglycohydrolase family protein [Actinomycetota bacterium]
MNKSNPTDHPPGNYPKDKIRGALFGAIVGDALGVPVEFKSREYLRQNPIVDMVGFGTHDQLPGTWSDDSSLMLCTLEALLNGFKPEHMGALFVRWLAEGYWTPEGKAFGIGRQTQAALSNIMNGTAAGEAGGTDELSNGNGALMRILPVALRYADAPDAELLHYAHLASSITHRHPRSQIACGLYCLMVSTLLKGFAPGEAYDYAIKEAGIHYQSGAYASELPHFERVLGGELARLDEAEIKSGGYVIHTLEAGIWSFLNSNSLEEVVLKAVNLGGDTDTTGIVAGGLAGLYYGFDSIPPQWIAALVKHEEINELIELFTTTT